MLVNNYVGRVGRMSLGGGDIPPVKKLKADSSIQQFSTESVDDEDLPF